MASRSHATLTGSMALLLALSAGGTAVAQTPTDPAMSEMETITVVAPRITYQVRRERGSAVPREVTVVEETALVNFGDLDLRRSADLFTLEGRISDAADRVCQAVAQEVPEGQPGTDVCVRRAIDDAMAQTQLIVRMANQR